MAKRDPRLDDKAWLTRRYVAEGASTLQIADELNCTMRTVKSALLRQGIPVRPSRRGGSHADPNAQRFLADAEWLTQRYLIDGADLREIAVEIGCSASTVHVALLGHGVTLRPRGWRPRSLPT